jgi:hypothetical protein
MKILKDIESLEVTANFGRCKVWKHLMHNSVKSGYLGIQGRCVRRPILYFDITHYGKKAIKINYLSNYILGSLLAASR